YIGTDVTAGGFGARVGFPTGIQIQGSNNNTIGGTAADNERNIISGMGAWVDSNFDGFVEPGEFVGGEGIVLDQSNKNMIQNNYLGTDLTGTYSNFALFNIQKGIRLSGSSGNTIGIGMPNITHPDGTITNLGRNVISGGGFFFPSFTDPLQETDPSGIVSADGIDLEENSNNNLIQNAYIGTNATGSDSSGSLANLGHAVVIWGSSDNTIGASTDAMTDNTLNVLSGNYRDGVRIQPFTYTDPSTNQQITLFSTGNEVLNTYIGTDSSGTTSDLFPADGGDGIGIYEGSDPTKPDVHNLIGLPGSPNNLKNLISGNLGNGIFIQGTAGVAIQDNFIGTDTFGLFSNSSLSNASNGVLVDASSGITIGGTTNGSGNVISGNLKAGIRIQGTPGDPTTGGNLIQGNKIGTTSSGNSDVGNGTDGIEIIGSPSNIIGGAVSSSVAGSQNIITGNNGNGILISGTFSPGQGNLVEGNIIGAKTATSQTAGNAFDGIALINTSGNTIGGTNVLDDNQNVDVLSGNIIAGNGFGSFTRTQLFSTGKVGESRSLVTDSYLSVAAGVFSNDLCFRAVVSQQLSNGVPVPGVPQQLVLSTIDATGTSTETAPVNLDSTFLPGLPLGGQYQFAVYTGKFLGDKNPDGTLQDDLLLTVTGSGINRVYI